MSSLSLTARPEASPRLRLPHRIDIQSMRGIAFLAYAANHLTPWLPGALGLIDMFFTISGYLITLRLILLAERGGVGRYFAEFYKFRARRLFPAAFVTLAVTVLTGYLLLIRARAHAIAVDSVWALLFVSNIRFTEQNTDYFHRTFDVSPLLAFWSLSVEEQFYLVWPVVVLVVLWIARRRGWATTGLVPVAALIAVVSFGYALWATHHDAVSAYYSTLVRAWDFAVGAILADIAVRRIRVREGGVGPGLFGGVHDRLGRHATVISWVGLSIILGAQVANPHNRGFPAPWGLPSVAGTALVIYAGIDRKPRNLILNNALLGRLGDISYSFYLVLFPVLVFAEPYLGGSPVVLAVFVLTASMALTLLLFYLIEEPARLGLVRTREWFRTRRYRPVLERTAVCGVTAVVVFAVAGQPGSGRFDQVSRGDLSTAQPREQPESGLNEPADPRAFRDPHAVAPIPLLGEAVRQGLAMTSWPTVTNQSSIDNMLAVLWPCGTPRDQANPVCIARPPAGTDPTKVVLAVGDSTILSYWPMLRDALVPLGWTVVLDAHTSCTAVLLRPGDEPNQACARYHASYAGLLDTWRPSLLLLAGSEQQYDLSPLGYALNTPAARRTRELLPQATRRTAAMARAHHARMVVLSVPPPRQAATTLGDCKVAGSVPSACDYTPARWWLAMDTRNRNDATRAGVTYADLIRYFCVSLRCPEVVGHLAVHDNPNHITPEYSASLAPSFRAYLLRQGLLG